MDIIRAWLGKIKARQETFDLFSKSCLHITPKVILNIGNLNPIAIGSPLWKRFELNIIAGGVMLNQDFKEFIQSTR
jgi:hypothetical protein